MFNFAEITTIVTALQKGYMEKGTKHQEIFEYIQTDSLDGEELTITRLALEDLLVDGYGHEDGSPVMTALDKLLVY